MHILHLEDSADDADLTGELLRARWPDCEVTQLTTQRDFEAAVRRGDFDLILSDYSLPGYTGLAALAFARVHAPEKPFIYISGTIGEERAVAALKMGAIDYVIKDRPARIISAIEAALLQTERAAAHRRAQEKVAEQAALLDKARDAIYVLDANGRVTYWNASAERLYGWPSVELIGRSAREVLHAETPAPFDAALALAVVNGEWRGELHPTSSRGDSVAVESLWSLVLDNFGQANSFLIIDSDITERKRLENQLMQVQRLETMSVLTGGIAHDLNNVLAPIITYVSFLRETLSAGADRELLDTLTASAQHGADLVRQLLSFARGEEGQLSILSIAPVIGSVQRLLHHVLPRNITVDVSSSSAILPIRGDATQLRQVLLNLCLNARDAMPEGGVLKISAEDVRSTVSERRIYGDAKPGPYVRITVKDTGSGISPQLIPRLFDPFFTTKPVGRGTGLGLANVAAIVKGHDGFIDVHSQETVGTSFEIHLPALCLEEAPRSAQISFLGRGEHVLLIEDDAAIREALELMLNTHGYKVTSVSDGAQGLAKYHARPNEFAVVMTDLRMPGIDGVEVIRELKGLSHPPKVIVLTGVEVVPEEMPMEVAGVAVLRKPVTAQTLLSALRRALHSSHD